jgi:hypothetical protein
MYELRYYYNTTKYEIVGTFTNPRLAYGLRKKYSLLPQYSTGKLVVEPV